jgi:hypothetical protein
MVFPVAMTLLYKTNPSANAKREDEERVDQRISVTAVELASIMSKIKGLPTQSCSRNGALHLPGLGHSLVDESGRSKGCLQQ